MPDEIEPSAPAGQQVVMTPAPAQQQQGQLTEMFPRSVVEELRRSEAGYRTKNKELTAAHEAAAKEVERLKGVDAKYRGLVIDGAVAEAAAKAGGNAKLVKLFVRDEVAGLDPEAKDFASSLAKIVETAIKDNPELKGAAQAAAPVVPKAGSDTTTPGTAQPVGDGQWTEAELAAARREGRHADIAKAQAEGKFANLTRARAGR